MLTSPEVIGLIDGLTYRQLDHWTVCGYLQPSDRAPADGTGVPRLWPDSEITVARIMHRLTRAGFRPKEAADLARRATASKDGITLSLGPGITLKVTP